MPKSEFAENLDTLQNEVSASLKPLGFRKKGRTFNRVKDDGLIDVVNFQTGPIPFYGRFAVNLGVLLPCVYEAMWQKSVGTFAQEYHCTIRARLGSLAFGKDEWFDWSRGISELANTVVHLLESFGLPFLEQFPDYAAVLSYYDRHGELPSLITCRSAVDAAIVAHHLGETVKSQTLFSSAYNSANAHFRPQVKKFADRLGYHIT